MEQVRYELVCLADFFCMFRHCWLISWKAKQAIRSLCLATNLVSRQSFFSFDMQGDAGSDAKLLADVVSWLGEFPHFQAV